MLTDLEQVSSLRNLEQIVNSDESSFQIIVESINGSPFTLDQIYPSSSIASIMQKIEAKDGIPSYIKRYVFEGKDLDISSTAQASGLEAGATIRCLLTIKGGLGEYAAMKYVQEKDIKRGNVLIEIAATQGESKALKNWGRNLQKDDSFWKEIQDQLGKTDSEMDDWLLTNAIHVKALIQETTKSGNCGDFARITHSHLVRTTTDQYVYVLYMCNPFPEIEQKDPTWKTECTNQEKIEWYLANDAEKKAINGNRRTRSPYRSSLYPKQYDHQLCITYHEPITDLGTVDLDRVMIADGWDRTMVCTLRQFVNGLNAYGATLRTDFLGISYPNLKISDGQLADGLGGLEGQGIKDEIAQIISSKLDDYKSSPNFQKDKEEGKKTNASDFNMAPPARVHNYVGNPQIKQKLDNIPLPAEMDVLQRECEALSPNAFFEYYSSVTGTQRGDEMVTDPFLQGLIFDAILPISSVALENICITFDQESFKQFFFFHIDAPTALMSSEILVQKIGLMLQNESDPNTIINICNSLSLDQLEETFATLRVADNIYRIITTLWGQGLVPQGDICLNAIAHLPTLKNVLPRLSSSELKRYLDDQQIWVNKNIIYGPRRGNKPTIHTIVQNLPTTNLIALRTEIGLDKWNTYVKKKLTTAQTQALG